MDRPDDADAARENDADRTAEAGATPTEDTAGLFWSDEEREEAPRLEPLEPGRPSPENILFVVLGALGTVALVLTAASPV